MELEVEHLAPYLPYGLEAVLSRNSKKVKISALSVFENVPHLSCGDNKMWLPITDFKPILRTLSYLTKEIEINGEKFIPFIKLANLFIMGINPKIIGSTNGGCVISHKENGEEYLMLSQHIVDGCFKLKLLSTGNIVNVDNLSIFQKLFEWHFDVYGLIPKWFAVDINTLSVQ